MAEKKEKKVEARDLVRQELAELIMEARGLTEIERTKEGLVIREGEQDIVVKIIQKKAKVEKADVVEVIKFGGAAEEPTEEPAAEEVEEEEEVEAAVEMVS